MSLYYDYGAPGELADRRVLARAIETEVMEKTPENVLILLKVSNDIITKRMQANSGPKGHCK